ncbi:MAG: hypothetical protein NC215_00380 [Ruminococcus sp.]|nr:hypothetical protein [Ruminococcus sp.]
MVIQILTLIALFLIAIYIGDLVFVSKKWFERDELEFWIEHSIKASVVDGKYDRLRIQSEAYCRIKRYNRKLEFGDFRAIFDSVWLELCVKEYKYKGDDEHV